MDNFNNFEELKKLLEMDENNKDYLNENFNNRNDNDIDLILKEFENKYNKFIKE